MGKAELAQAVRLNREEANRLAVDVGHAKLKTIMSKAQDQLTKRLHNAEGLKGPGADSFTATRMRLTMRQIEDLTYALGPELKTLILDQGETAADASTQNMIDYMQAAEQHFTGIGQPLPIKEAAMFDQTRHGVESSLLNRISSNPDDPAGFGILERYGVETIRQFEEKIQMGMLTRASWSDVRKDIIESSDFLKGSPMFWAERIVRTETMGAYSRASTEVILEADEQLGDMCRILSATFDDRTGWDSYQVHGQIRRPHEPFQWGEGSYMNPPNRPNDREVVVPHRIAWPIPAFLKWRDDGEVLDRYNKQRKSGSPGPRPNMTTIPLTEFGKPSKKAEQPKQEAEPTVVQVPEQVAPPVASPGAQKEDSKKTESEPIESPRVRAEAAKTADRLMMDEYRKFVPNGWNEDHPEGMPKSSLIEHWRDGQPKPSRAAIVKEIEDHAFLDKDGKPIVGGHEVPTVIVMMGGPGSGKSTALKHDKADGKLDNYVSVDPDDIKLKLPEYKQAQDAKSMLAAPIVHEESSTIAKRIAARAQESRHNILLDGVGSDEAKMIAAIEKYRALGYKIDLRMVHAPMNVGLGWALGRAEKTGRKPPADFAEAAYPSIPKVFKTIENMADTATVYSSVKGAAMYANGKILDQDAAELYAEYTGEKLGR